MSARSAQPLPAYLAGLLLILCGAPAWAGAPLIPLQDFAAGPEMSAPRLSPDGSHLVYLTTFQGARYVAIYDMKEGHSLPILSGTSGDFQVTRCDFKTDTLLLCHMRGLMRWMGNDTFTGTRLISLDRDGKHLKMLFQGDSYTDNIGRIGSQSQDRVVHMLPDDPQHVLIEITEAGSMFPSVYQLNVSNGSMRLLVPSHGPVLSWLADREGAVRFGAGFHESEGVYLARDGAEAPWRTLARFPLFARTEFQPLAFGPLPNQLFVAAPHQGRYAIWQIDLDEKSDHQLVFARPDVDVESVVTWPTDGHVVGFAYEDARPHIAFVDPHAEALNATVEQAVPNTFHRVISASRDGQLVLFSSFSDVVPPVYHLLNTRAHTLMAIGQQSKALSHAQLAPTKPVMIPGPGGVNIPGYLTLPVGTSPDTPIPAVVFPHGGPYSRDYWGYDPIVQLMANRGYAVLQMNFRGSTGYGTEWRSAGNQQWGTVIHSDITAGARWLIDQHVADPARMCIVGWSFGGYAALIGVVKEPQLYKCAVSIAGVSDVSKLAAERIRWYGGKTATEDMTGTDPVLLAAESPVLHAEHIKVPVLLVHGEDDTTVMPEHSKAMARALERNAVPHELVMIKDGEHSLLEPSMRLTLYAKLEAFLGANLGKP